MARTCDLSFIGESPLFGRQEGLVFQETRLRLVDQHCQRFSGALASETIARVEISPSTQCVCCSLLLKGQEK